MELYSEFQLIAELFGPQLNCFCGFSLLVIRVILRHISLRNR